MRNFFLGALVCAAASLAPGVLLLAQGSAPPPPQVARAPVVPVPGRIVAINPLMPLLKSFSGEFEGRVSRAVTLGVSGTYYGADGGDDDDYYHFDFVSSGDLHLRYYPGERAPAGFAIGATLGVARSDDDIACPAVVGGSCRSGSRTAGSYGTDLSYNWLLGPEHRSFAVGIGVGVKRLMRPLLSGVEVLPTLRLQVGYAF